MNFSPIAVWKDRLCTLIVTPLHGRTWWVIVLIASACGFLTAALISPHLMGAQLIPDFLCGYHPGAVGFQNGNGYVDQSGEFITRWPPGWSLFISPWVVEDAGGSIGYLRVISGILTAVWVVLFALVARFLLPRVSIAVVLAIGVFWPPMLAAGNPMTSEMLFLVLSTVALLLLFRLYRLSTPSVGHTVALTVAAWLALAAAALTKTSGIAVAGAMCIGIVVGFHAWSLGRRIAVLILSIVVFSVALSPWVLTYKKNTGHIGFTSSGLITIRHGLQRYPHFPLGLELQERSEKWQTYDDIWSDLSEVAADDPLGALRLCGIKLVRPWYATWVGRFDRLLFIVQLPWLVLFVLTSGRTALRWRQTPGEIILLHGYVASLWLTAAFVAPLLRYLAPAFPFVVIVTFWHAVDGGLFGSEDLGESQAPTVDSLEAEV